MQLQIVLRAVTSLVFSCCLLAVVAHGQPGPGPNVPLKAPVQETIAIDAQAPAKPFPHFWEQMFGSGRAILSLRESYREDLAAVKKVADFRYVRFHAIFHDEVGVYNEDEHGNPVYNFAYVDQIYDGLLKNGVRPFVEISFMPKKLAFNPDALHPFWYKPNVSPPKSMERWDDLHPTLRAAPGGPLWHRRSVAVVLRSVERAEHRLLERHTAQRSYFDLYAHTARDLKAVNPGCAWAGPPPRRRLGSTPS